ncbi:hypothetical protein MRX96_016116 [Rhipicephalus microplus]
MSFAARYYPRELNTFPQRARVGCNWAANITRKREPTEEGAAGPGLIRASTIPRTTRLDLATAVIPQRRSWRVAGVVPGAGLSRFEVPLLACTVQATLRGTVPVDVPSVVPGADTAALGFLHGMYQLNRAMHRY